MTPPKDEPATRRPVIQASNAGPSLVVSARGEITAQTGFGVEALLEGAVAPADERSVYTSLGDAPLLALAGLVCAAGCILALRRKAACAPPARETRGGRRLILSLARGTGWLGASASAGLLLALASLAAVGRVLPDPEPTFAQSLRALLAPAVDDGSYGYGRRRLPS